MQFILADYRRILLALPPHVRPRILANYIGYVPENLRAQFLLLAHPPP